jgi:hypothetical protein
VKISIKEGHPWIHPRYLTAFEAREDQTFGGHVIYEGKGKRKMGMVRALEVMPDESEAVKKWEQKTSKQFGNDSYLWKRKGFRTTAGYRKADAQKEKAFFKEKMLGKKDTKAKETNTGKNKMNLNEAANTTAASSSSSAAAAAGEGNVKD